MASNCSCSLLLLCLFVLLMLPAAMQAIRIPKNSSSNNVATASTSATSADNNAKAGSKYGESYKVENTCRQLQGLMEVADNLHRKKIKFY